jgi:hypothetical protein
MSDNGAVFKSTNLISTSTAVPDAGSDNHIPIKGSAAKWKSISNQTFLDGYPAGQHQTLVKSADEIVEIKKNQKTTVQEEIVITSATKKIHVKAATEITLEVGASKLRMMQDGTIELTGNHVTITGSQMVDINP